MTPLEQAYLIGYETALEKLGFYSEEALGMLKSAASLAEMFGKIRGGLEQLGPEMEAGGQVSPEKIREIFEGAMSQGQGPESAAVSDLVDAMHNIPEAARNVAGDVKATAQGAAAGAMAPRPVQWFLRQPGWAQGLMGGGALAGAGGIGFGLGRATAPEHEFGP